MYSPIVNDECDSHHAFPWSARQGFGAWWREPDLSYALLRVLERLGVVWDLKVPSEEQIERAKASKLLTARNPQPPTARSAQPPTASTLRTE